VSEFDVTGRIRYTDEGASATLTKVTGAVDAQTVALAKENAEYVRLRAAAEQTIKAQQMFGAQTQTITTTTATATTNVGQFGSAVGLAGQAIGRVNPAMGGLVTMAGSALGAIQALTTAGMGPFGIALAATSLALSAATALYAAFGDEQRDAADAADELTASLYEQNRANDLAGEGRMRVLEAEELRLQRTVDTLRASHGDAVLLYQQEQLLNEARQRLMRERQTDTTTAAPRARSEGEVLAEMARLSEGLTSEGRTIQAPTGGTAGEAARKARADAARQQAEEDAQGREADSAARLAMLIEDMDAEAEVRAMMREREINESNAAKDQSIEIERARVAGVKAALDAETALRAKAAKTQQQILDTTGQAHTLLASVIEASAGSSEKSQKAKTQALAAASMVQSGIEMAVEIARIAQSYPDPVGMATHAIGAANFAVAIGVAAAAAGGGGSAPPSGGASVPAASSPGGGPSGPPAGAQEPGGNVYNITLGGGGVVYAADRNELMRTIADGVRAADTRRGR